VVGYSLFNLPSILLHTSAHSNCIHQLVHAAHPNVPNAHSHTHYQQQSKQAIAAMKYGTPNATKIGLLSTGSFPDLLDPSAIYGSKYDPENAYSRSRERSRDRFRDRSRNRSRNRSRDDLGNDIENAPRIVLRTMSRTFQGSFSGTISIAGGSSSKNVL